MPRRQAARFFPHSLLSAKIGAALYEAGQRGETFTVQDLGLKLRLKPGKPRDQIANLLLQWFRQHRVERIPSVGKFTYRVVPAALAYFQPRPPPPVPVEPEPAPARPGAAQAQPTPSTQTGTLDAMFHRWLDSQLKPYGTMLQAVVGEVGRLRKEVDNMMELLSRPEGDRPAMTEPSWKPPPPFDEAFAQAKAGSVRDAPPGPLGPLVDAKLRLPVEDTALAVVISRLGPEWHVNPTACREFDELDGLTQGRAVRVLRAAASMHDAWPKLGKQISLNHHVPASYQRPGTFWAFRAGKKDRVIVRRNGKEITLEALVKRNDHRWYGSEAGPRGR